jgi:hypothetical protein
MIHEKSSLSFFLCVFIFFYYIDIPMIEQNTEEEKESYTN